MSGKPPRGDAAASRPTTEGVLQEGDIVWAKMPGFPLWPAIVFFSTQSLFDHGLQIPPNMTASIDSPMVCFLDSLQYGCVTRTSIKPYLSYDVKLAFQAVKSKKTLKKTLELAVERAEQILYQRSYITWTVKDYEAITGSIAMQEMPTSRPAAIASDVEEFVESDEHEEEEASEEEFQVKNEGGNRRQTSRSVKAVHPTTPPTKRSRPVRSTSAKEDATPQQRPPSSRRGKVATNSPLERPSPHSARASARHKLEIAEEPAAASAVVVAKKPSPVHSDKGSKKDKAAAPQPVGTVIENEEVATVPKSDDESDEDGDDDDDDDDDHDDDDDDEEEEDGPGLGDLTDEQIAFLEKKLAREKAKRAKKREAKRAKRKAAREAATAQVPDAKPLKTSKPAPLEKQPSRESLKRKQDQVTSAPPLTPREEGAKRHAARLKAALDLTKDRLVKPDMDTWMKMSGAAKADFYAHEKRYKRALKLLEDEREAVESRERRQAGAKRPVNAEPVDFDSWMIEKNEQPHNKQPSRPISPRSASRERSRSPPRPKRVKAAARPRPDEKAPQGQQLETSKPLAKRPSLAKPDPAVLADLAADPPIPRKKKVAPVPKADHPADDKALRERHPRDAIAPKALETAVVAVSDNAPEKKQPPIAKRGRPAKAAVDSDDDVIEMWKPLKQDVPPAPSSSRQWKRNLNKKQRLLSKYRGPVQQSPLSMIWQRKNTSFRCHTDYIWDNSVFNDPSTNGATGFLDAAAAAGVDGATGALVRGKRQVKSVQHAQIRQNLMLNNLDPHTMVECIQYANDGKTQAESKTLVQPYDVRVHPDAMFVCDLHSHLAICEIIGFLGGRFDEATNTIFIHAAFPCRSLTIAGDDGATDVEMDPESELELRELIRKSHLDVVGWYHSHPAFAPDPSVRDIENQSNYQALFASDKVVVDETMPIPFVGLIVGTYDPKRTIPAGLFRFFHVRGEKGGTGQRGRVVYLPYELQAKTRQYNVKSTVDDDVPMVASALLALPTSASSTVAATAIRKDEPPTDQNAAVGSVLQDEAEVVSKDGGADGATSPASADSVGEGDDDDVVTWTAEEQDLFEAAYLRGESVDAMAIPTKSRDEIADYFDEFTRGKTRAGGQVQGRVLSFEPHLRLSITLPPQVHAADASRDRLRTKYGRGVLDCVEQVLQLIDYYRTFNRRVNLKDSWYKKMNKLDKIRQSLREYAKDLDVPDGMHQAFVEDIVQYLDLSWS